LEPPNPESSIPNPVGIPVLIYDGDCGFCRYWLARLRRRVGERMEYLPFQDPQIPVRFPHLSISRLKESVHVVAVDGTLYKGARAVFEALALGGMKLPIRAYRWVPGGALLSEAAYRFVARRRKFFGRFQHR
jgi:predicted DCC family thiol-disulfide oxidoreductase YuxK